LRQLYPEPQADLLLLFDRRRFFGSSGARRPLLRPRYQCISGRRFGRFTIPRAAARLRKQS